MHELLNFNKIKGFLSSETRFLLPQIDIFETLNSTNTYLLNLAKTTNHHPRLCLAEEQTAGRGRQGKTWLSPKGSNIYASLLWTFPSLSPDLSGLSLAVAVILQKALHRYGLLEGLELKWPNDIFFKGKKFAGILIEGIQSFDQAYHCVIGLGISCAKAWVDLAEITGRSVARNELVGLVVDELLLALPVFAEKGLSAFIEEFREYDVLIGKPIAIQDHDRVMSGVACGISDQGELLVEVEGRVSAFRCGEVSIKMA